MLSIHKKGCILGLVSLLSITVFCYWYFLVRVPAMPELPDNVGMNSKGIIEHSFVFRCNLPGNSMTTVRYMIPLDCKTGLPLASASTIVFYAPFNGEANKIRKELPKWTHYFPEKAGFSIFSLSIDVTEECNVSSKNYYVYSQGGWYKLIWEIKRHLEKSYLLENRPMLLTGQSSGGSLTEHLIAAYPEKIAAAAWNGATKYTRLPPSAARIPMLALHTEGCYAIPRTQAFLKQCTSNGIQLKTGIIPPNETEKSRGNLHSATDLACQLMCLFLTAPEAFDKMWKEHSEIQTLF